MYSNHLVTGGYHFNDKFQAFACRPLCIMPSALMKNRIVINLSDFIIKCFTCAIFITIPRIFHYDFHNIARDILLRFLFMPGVYHCDFHNIAWDISL